MKVLVINAGSSSLKYQFLDSESEVVLAKGNCERIGIDGSRIIHKCTGKDEYVKEQALPDHSAAMKLLVDTLVDPEFGCVSSVDEIEAVGHRVVHGGQFFADSVILTDEVLEAVEKCIVFAPLHNPAHIMGIKGCLEAADRQLTVFRGDNAGTMAIVLCHTENRHIITHGANQRLYCCYMALTAV